MQETLSRVKSIAKDFIHSREWPKRPQCLNFEITAICDSKCIHCPRQEMDRPMRPMPLDLFKKMIDQAAELDIPELCPNGYGELLTIRNLDEYFEYISANHPKAKILINTNGYRLTDEKINLFFKHKVKLLNICIDGATAATAEAIRVNLKTATIEDNIHRLLAMRKVRGLKYPKIRVGMVLIPQNLHETDQFIEKWTGVADYVGFGGFSNRAGSVTLDKDAVTDTSLSPHSTCVLPFKALNIYADGKAVLCCNDWNEEYVVGDLNNQHIREIWTGTALTEARHLHMAKRGQEMEICAKCNYWQEPGITSTLWV